MPSGELMEEFKKRVNNDVNAPQALAFVWDIVNNKSLPNRLKKATILEFDKVLGLGLVNKVADEITDKVLKLVQKREDLRKNKMWQAADQIRLEIIANGYDIEDTINGTRIIKTGRS